MMIQLLLYGFSVEITEKVYVEALGFPSLSQKKRKKKW